MTFEDKLIELRRQRGFSQEMLADLLNVSRQAVSKWEAGRAMPDVPKLIAMAELYDVSLDELLRDKLPPKQAEGPAVVGQLVAAGGLAREYKSRTTLFGLPLVHVNYGGLYGRRRVAKGIIAIGDIAVGVVALGGLSLGVVALGGLSLGLLFALGGLSVGCFAAGGVAVGLYALGGVAVGLYSFGGLAVAGRVAFGGLAVGRVAVGGHAVGRLASFTGENMPATFERFSAAVRHAVPRAPEFFTRLIYGLMTWG